MGKEKKNWERRGRGRGGGEGERTNHLEGVLLRTGAKEEKGFG